MWWKLGGPDKLCTHLIVLQLILQTFIVAHHILHGLYEAFDVCQLIFHISECIIHKPTEEHITTVS